METGSKFYEKAILLKDDMTLIIRYEITKNNVGKIQLSNSIKLMDHKLTKKLKMVLSFIEDYVTEYYFAPLHDS